MKKTKKVTKRIVALAIGAISACSCSFLSACTAMPGAANVASVHAQSNKANVWTTSALAKVLHDGEFSDNLSDYGRGTSVDIEMARNEYEDGQIIISALEDIKEYSVSVGDLSDGKGNKIAKENVEFYHQKYVLIEKKTVASSPFALGEYPEALVPMESAVEYGENNVKAGESQGIYVTVKTEHETVAGTYTGVVKVIIDGQTHDVPIRVKVWDIDISDEFHCSYTSVYSTSMSFINDGDATQEKMEAISEFFLKYRVYNETLTVEEKDHDAFVQGLVKNKNNSRFRVPLTFMYNPFYTKDGLVYWDENAMRTLIMKIIEQSVQDEFLYPNLVHYYPYWYDEWQFKYGEGEDAAIAYLTNMRDEALFFESICEEAVAIYDACYGEDKIDSVEGLRESVLNIKKMISGEYNELSAPYMEVYDILIVSNWQFNQEERAFIESIVEKGFEFGAYNCNWPRYPQLAVHVDSSLVEARIWGFQIYDFDAIGMYYHRLGNDASFENVYENLNDVMLKFTANGDGHLAYPGEYYGLDGLVASNRLHAIRDSLEDYEYLYILEEAYQALSEYYNAPLSADEFLNSLYYTLYSNNVDYKPNRDVNVFYGVREQLFQAIISAQSQDKMVLETKYDTADKTIVKMLFSADCQLQNVNDNPYFVSKEATGQGYRYTFEYPRNEDNHSLEITYTIGGETKTYELDVNRGSVVIDSFANNEQGLLSATNNVSIQSVTHNAQAMTELTFTSVITGDAITDEAYLSRAFIDVEPLLAFVEGANGFTVEVYNPTNKDITINLYYETMVLDKPITSVTIEANGYKTLTFDNIDELKKALNIIIQVPNTGTTDTPDVYKLIISNLKYIKKGD